MSNNHIVDSGRDVLVTDALSSTGYWSGGVVIEPYTFIDGEGNRIHDLEEIYKHVSKLYFDKQLKEIIEDDTTTKA